MEIRKENRRIFGVSGFIGRRWYWINAVIMIILGHALLKIMQLPIVPTIFVYALIPIAIFYVYGLVYRRAIDVLGGKRWRWLPAIVAVGILFPVADLLFSGLMSLIPGKLSRQQVSTWRFQAEQIVAIVIALALTAFVIIFEPTVGKPILHEKIENSSSSMEPNLKTGQDVFVQKDFDTASLKRGDVVAVDVRGKLSIKRIIGIAGDKVRFKGHSVWLNGVELQQSIPTNASEVLAKLPDKNIETSGEGNIKAEYEIRRETVESNSYLILQRKENVTAEFLTGEYKVDSQMIWILGDNRDNALDSRMDGPVAISNIVGRILPSGETDNNEH